MSLSKDTINETLRLRKVSCAPNEKRLLSALEHFYVKAGASTGITTYFHSLVLNSTKEINESHVRSCFFEISKTQSLLRVHCKEEENGDLSFEIQDNYLKENNWINIECINVNNQNEWIKHVTENMSSKLFDVFNEPLWRILWLVCPVNQDESFTYVLIFIANHVISDGKSVSDLLTNKFMVLLNNLDIDESVSAVALAYPFEAVFSYKENYTENYSLMDFIIPAIYKGVLNVGLWLIDKTIPSKPKMRSFDKKNTELNVICHYPFIINENETKNFIKVCKEEKVTVNTSLMLLVSNALESAESSIESLKKCGNAVSYAIDFRKFNTELSTSPIVLGVYTVMGRQKIKPVKLDDRKTFFATARKLGEKIKATNKVKDYSKDIFTYAVAHVLRTKTMDDLLKNQAQQLVSVTNLGRVVENSPVKNGFVKITEQYFSVSVRESFGGVTISVLTYDNKLCFVIGCDSNWLSEDFAQVLATDLQKSISTVGNFTM